MSDKYVYPIPESQPAEWLKEGEELYLPEITKEGSITTRRVAKDEKKAPQTLSRIRHNAGGGEEGLTWDEWDRISSGGGSIAAQDMGILTPDKFRLWGEEQDAQAEDSWDENSAEKEYVAEFDQNMAILSSPMPDRNLEAEAEVAKYGRKLVGQESTTQQAVPCGSVIKVIE